MDNLFFKNDLFSLLGNYYRPLTQSVKKETGKEMIRIRSYGTGLGQNGCF
jgi:hypothetical protein